jgi:hypothetical protein
VVYRFGFMNHWASKQFFSKFGELTNSGNGIFLNNSHKY